jgi:hypothetical protein
VDSRSAESGHRRDPVLPFITWPFQDDYIRAAEEVFGKEDLVSVKTRGVSWTWMIIALFTHRWQFGQWVALGLVSREASLVDGSNKSLFHKVDFLLHRQPDFLVPRYFRKEMYLKALATGSSMEGATTTGDVFRGDRYTAVMVDELAAFELSQGHKALASTNGATYCRYFGSTPQGSVGAFYDVAHNSSIRRHDLPWEHHPEMSKGSYVDVSGKLRSPWYDKECRRLVLGTLIASELDRDFAGSASPFFPADVLERHLQTHGRPPVERYSFQIDLRDPRKIQLFPDPNGPLKLWLRVDPVSRKPNPADSFVGGGDLSTGTGATPSTLSFADRFTREKVAEFVTARLSPEKFADFVHALAWWFNEAMLGWELNGPGVQFSKRMMELGYRNVYYRRDEQGLEKKVSKGLVPGWHSSVKNKRTMLGAYLTALSENTFINRSREALDECKLYYFMPNNNNAVENARARAFSDPSGAWENHGDRVIADGICNMLLGQAPEIEIQEQDPFSLDGPAEPYSWKWRRQRAVQADAQRADTWASPITSGWESNLFSDEPQTGQWNETPQTMRGW